jgi:GH25 family lysozyme M1 (1,4-beta-N-acetylmuramidase)
MIKGTDLSHWNTLVKYDQMEDAGIRFGCLKLGQGRLNKDPMFDTHRAAFYQRNLPWDLYWFSDYRYSGADNVLNLIAKANGDFGQDHPVMDLEFYDGFGPRPDGPHMRRFAIDFLGELESRTGLLAMFYSNRDVINQIMAGITLADKSKLLRHDLWLATDASYGNPAPWPKYRLNQYELDLVVPWSNSTVDLDDFNGTETEFAAWYGGKPPARNLTVEEKVDVIEDEARAKGWTLWEV